MNDTLKKLYELQTLEFGQIVVGDSAQRVAALRAELPAPVLSHYDRLCSAGKKGIVLVRNQSCSGCHIRIPLGTLMEIKRGDTLKLCDNCRRYLYLLAEPVTAAEVIPVRKLSAPKKSRGYLVSIP